MALKMKENTNTFYSLTDHEKAMFLIGIIGLIPFAIGLLDLLFNEENLILPFNIVKYYGAIILTFLGSIYWGIILNQNEVIIFTNKFKILTLIWSVSPALLSLIVLLIDKNISLIILSFGYLVCQVIDEIYKDILKFPKCYISLRRFLSLTVISILISFYFIIEY